MIPRLLVSVRNAAEALAAFHGGADIIDVKEPDNGPLGRPSAASIDSIVRILGAERTTVPVSIALGEAHEWLDAAQSEQNDVVRRVTAARGDIAFVKLGLANGLNNWSGAWASVRSRFSLSVISSTADPSGEDSTSMRVPRWVAVAYADFRRCHAPSIEQVVTEAARVACSGVLVDTFVKDGSGLFQWCSTADLAALRMSTQENGMTLALAGQLNVSDLQTLCDIQPDVVAIRGAVCTEGARSNQVDVERVKQFKSRLEESFRAIHRT